MKCQKRTSYPLRMDVGVREGVEKLAAERDRSLNWQLNELLKIGLENFAAQKENATAAETVMASM